MTELENMQRAKIYMEKLETVSTLWTVVLFLMMKL